jgi:hypothetical protein
MRRRRATLYKTYFALGLIRLIIRLFDSSTLELLDCWTVGNGVRGTLPDSSLLALALQVALLRPEHGRCSECARTRERPAEGSQSFLLAYLALQACKPFRLQTKCKYGVSYGGTSSMCYVSVGGPLIIHHRLSWKTILDFLTPVLFLMEPLGKVGNPFAILGDDSLKCF